MSIARLSAGHTIGRYAFVGTGAVVTKAVPDHALVIDTPGRIVGWMCRCGVKLKTKGAHLYCAECGTRYRKAGSGLTLLTADSTQTRKSVA